MSSTNRFINAIERFSTRMLGPAPMQEKLKSVSASTGKGLYSRGYGQQPRSIRGYYDWYNSDGAVYAGINSITEMAVGNGFETALPGLAPSDMEDEDSPEKKLVDEFNEYINADDLNANICRNVLIAGYCPVEVKMNKYPSRCEVGIIHPKTVVHIEIGGAEYHGIKYIIQKVGHNKAKIMGRNLAWFDHNAIGNDKRGTSIIKPVETLLSTKLNTINQIEKIIDKRLAPMIIWKSTRNIESLKEAVTGIKPDEDIFLGNLTQEELKDIAQPIDIGESGKLWEYIEYIDRLIYKSLFTGDLDYWRQATQASATILQELVDYNVRGIRRSIKRGNEAGFYARLMKLNGYKTVPRVNWTTENAKFRGIQLERFLQTGVNAGFVQLPQYYEILQRSGLDLHPPDKPLLPPQPVNPIIKKTPDIEK